MFDDEPDVLITDKSPYARTDSEGRFRLPLDSITTDSARFVVVHPHFRILAGEVRRLDSPQRFVLHTGERIAGRARFPDGLPAPGLEVLAGDNSVYTDATGSFMLGGLDAGAVSVFCETTGAEIVAETGDFAIDLVVEASLVLVRATNSAGTRVHPVTCRGKIGAHVFTEPLAPVPLCSILVWPKESGWIVVNAEGYLPQRFDILSRTAAPRLREFKAVLSKVPDNSLTVRIRDSKRAFVESPGATLEVLDADDVVLSRVRIDLQSGVGAVRGLPAGRTRLRVYAPWREVAQVREVEIPERGACTVEFRLPPAGDLRVLWRSNGTRYRLALEDLAGKRLTTVLGQVGRKDVWISTSPVAFGRYRLLEINAGEVLRKTVVEIASERRTTVEWMD